MTADPGPADEAQPVDPLPPQGLLQYAPPARGNRRRRLIAVLASGIGTSIIAIIGVYLYARYEREDPLTWHVFFLVPVGSILAAIIAASGYVVASLIVHVRGGVRLAITAATLNLLTYVAALYVQFAPFNWVNAHTGQPVTFVQYVHERSISWTWKSHGEVTQLGLFGYVYRVVDVVAFAGIAAFAVLMMSSTSYCDLCQSYLTNKRLALFPASMPYQSLDGMTAEDRAAFQAEQEELTLAAVEGGKLMLTLAEAGDVASVRQAIAAVRPEQRATGRLPIRLALDIQTCPICRTTSLSTYLLVGKATRHLETLSVSGAFAELLRQDDD